MRSYIFFALALFSIICVATGMTPWPFGDGVFLVIGIVSLYVLLAERFDLRIPCAPYFLIATLGLIGLSYYFLFDPFQPALLAAAIVFGIACMKKPKASHGLDTVDVPESSSRREWAALACLALVILAGILAYAHSVKTIDSDEARLIFDGKLVSQGFTPFLDFNSRAPALVYSLGALYPLLGSDFPAYHMLAGGFFWMSLVFLFLLARRFVGRGQSLIIVLAFAALPVALNFLYFKTQTFEMAFVLASCLLFVHAKGKKPLPLVLSHLCMLVALYIRPTAALFYAFPALYLFFSVEKKEWVKEGIRLASGIAATGLAFIIPTALFFQSSHALFYTSVLKTFAIDELSVRRFAMTPFYIPLSAIALCGAALVGLRKNTVFRHPFFAMNAAMLGILGAAYFCNALLLGFWPQYYMEFSVGIAVVLSYAIVWIYRSAGRGRIFWGVFIAFMLLPLPVTDFVLRDRIGLYDMQSVSNASLWIHANTAPGDTVFSGNPLFALASGRPQYKNLSHSYYDTASADLVIAAMEKEKPAVIVDDYFIATNYMWKGRFRNLLETSYSAVATFPSEEPFTIYLLKN